MRESTKAIQTRGAARRGMQSINIETLTREVPKLRLGESRQRNSALSTRGKKRNSGSSRPQGMPHGGGAQQKAIESQSRGSNRKRENKEGGTHNTQGTQHYRCPAENGGLLHQEALKG